MLPTASALAACGHHLFARIAIVFSRLCSVPKLLQVTFVYFPPLLSRHPVPPCTFHILLLRVLSSRMCAQLSTALPHGHVCAPTSSWLLVYLLLSDKSRSPTLNRSLSEVHWPVQITFHHIPSLDPPVYLSTGFSDFTSFLSTSLPLFLLFLLLLS